MKRRIRLPVMQVAMAIEPGSNGDATVRLAFKGAAKMMLTHVFTALKGKLFDDYSMAEEIATRMRNGACSRTLTVSIEGPDFHRLSLCEWPAIIRHLMERTFRCRLTFFDKYDKFLNA